MPVIGFLGAESAELWAHRLLPFHQGLGQVGFVEGRNVAIEYRWGAQGRNDRLPALAAELIGRQVNVIAAPTSTPAALTLKAATETIPIVFYVAGDPVRLAELEQLGVVFCDFARSGASRINGLDGVRG